MIFSWKTLKQLGISSTKGCFWHYVASGFFSVLQSPWRQLRTQFYEASNGMWQRSLLTIFATSCHSWVSPLFPPILCRPSCPSCPSYPPIAQVASREPIIPSFVASSDHSLLSDSLQSFGRAKILYFEEKKTHKNTVDKKCQGLKVYVKEGGFVEYYVP